jgi:hypothetical protein
MAVRGIQEELARWSDQTKIAPVKVWAGYGVTADNRPPSIERLREQLDLGVAGVWLPIFNHANTYNLVGAKTIWIDKNAGPGDHTTPMPWDEAVRLGHYMLDENGKLKPVYEEIVRVAADRDVALFFGHATHPEIYALTELVTKLNFKRAVIDHPFSPFIELSVAQMKELAAAGVYMNFTFDEISPLLGVDPQKMYAAIREIGVAQVTLSSDGGEPLFPHSVECMRLIRGFMEAFGLTPDELETVSARNPGKLVGVN